MKITYTAFDKEYQATWWGPVALADELENFLSNNEVDVTYERFERLVRLGEQMLLQSNVELEPPYLAHWLVLNEKELEDKSVKDALRMYIF